MQEPVIFDEAISRMLEARSYLGLLVGRPQNIDAIHLRLKSDVERASSLKVYWSVSPKRESSDDDRGPHPSDVLLDAIREPDNFSGVMQKWLNRLEGWRDARWRFFNCFAEQNRYDHDRLIGAANMFDLLPDSAIPANVSLPFELQAAKKNAKEIFAKLPDSPERNSLLSELGRLGKSKLKHKIRHRAQIISEHDPNRFPELTLVTDEAVNCRNHYVHGAKPTIDYSRNFFETVAFFTKTLEFVFAASDLIEAGWEMKNWASEGGTLSHPFSQYRYGYKESLKRLKALLSN